MGANTLDKLIGYVAPKLALERVASRKRMEILENLRAYDGASRSRRGGSWTTTNNSADAEIAVAGSTLRSRSRDLVRNNPHAAKAVSTFADQIIGKGIIPRAQTGDPDLNEHINNRFKIFSEECDPERLQTFYGQQYLAARALVSDGEILARRRWRRATDNLSTPTQVQLIEADLLDDQKHGEHGANTIISGVEFNPIGQRRGYWMKESHPGENFVTQKLPNSSKFISSDDIAHLFEKQRTQTRGVPWLTPAMMSLRDLDEYSQAEIIRKKIEACVVAIVVPEEDSYAAPLDGVDDGSDALGIYDSEGNEYERFEPGMIAYARGGKDVKFNNPSVSAGYEQYFRTQMRRVSAGIRMPYEILTGDLSQLNFAGGRTGIIEYRRFIRSIQWHVMIPMFCRPIWRWFIEAERLMGEIPTQAHVGVEWSPPKFEAISPIDDMRADLIAVRSGFKTLQEVIAEHGQNAAEVMKDINEMHKITDGLGIILDSDPRKVSLNGGLQDVAGETTPEGGDDA